MSFVLNFPLFAVVLCLISAVLSSVLPGRAARRLAMTLYAVIAVMNACVLVYTGTAGEAFSYMMGHYPQPWGNELKIGILEPLFSMAFSVVLLLTVLGGRRQLDTDLEPAKANLYYVLTDLIQAALLVLVYTNDLFTGYVFIEICTIAACGILMICHAGRTALAAVRYMLFSLVGSGLFLFGVYMLLFNLGIIPAQYKLTWAMAWPVALILIGVTILLHFLLPKRKKEGGIFEVEKSDSVFDCTDESGFIRIDSAFTSQTKCVETGAPFTGAKIDSSFGSLVLDLSQAEIQNGALIDADVSFGSLTVRLPAFVGANAACKTAFGGYDCPPGNPDAEIKVSLNGDVSFGKIEVEYV